jgi:hypothetical protein
MAGKYDILVQLTAKAEEVKQAAAAIEALSKKVGDVGGGAESAAGRAGRAFETLGGSARDVCERIARGAAGIGRIGAGEVSSAGGGASGGGNGPTFVEALRDEAIDLEAQWSASSVNIARAITQNIETAVSGVSNAITGLITGTMNWRQAFGRAATSIVGSLVQIGVQMIASQLLGAALGRSAAQQQSANNAQIASSGAAAAAVTSISSYGAAAVVGTALALAGIGAIIAAVAGGFAEGGLIPGQPSNRDNRLARVATGEYIVRAAAVNHYGAGLFHSLNDMRAPGVRGAYAGGGLVSAAGDYPSLISPGAAAGGGQGESRARGSKVVIVEDRRAAMKELLRDPGMRGEILDLVRGSRHEIGIV